MGCRCCGDGGKSLVRIEIWSDASGSELCEEHARLPGDIGKLA